MAAPEHRAIPRLAVMVVDMGVRSAEALGSCVRMMVFEGRHRDAMDAVSLVTDAALDAKYADWGAAGVPSIVTTFLTRGALRHVLRGASLLLSARPDAEDAWQVVFRLQELVTRDAQRAGLDLELRHFTRVLEAGPSCGAYVYALSSMCNVLPLSRGDDACMAWLRQPIVVALASGWLPSRMPLASSGEKLSTAATLTLLVWSKLLGAAEAPADCVEAALTIARHGGSCDAAAAALRLVMLAGRAVDAAQLDDMRQLAFGAYVEARKGEFVGDVAQARELLFMVEQLRRGIHAAA